MLLLMFLNFLLAGKQNSKVSWHLAESAISVTIDKKRCLIRSWKMCGSRLFSFIVGG